jgi:hypothetical protein
VKESALVHTESEEVKRFRMEVAVGDEAAVLPRPIPRV